MPSPETATPQSRALAAKVKATRAEALRALGNMDDYFDRCCCHEFATKEDCEAAWTLAHRAVTRTQEEAAAAFRAFVLNACAEYGIKP